MHAMPLGGRGAVRGEHQLVRDAAAAPPAGAAAARLALGGAVAAAIAAATVATGWHCIVAATATGAAAFTASCLTDSSPASP